MAEVIALGKRDARWAPYGTLLDRLRAERPLVAAATENAMQGMTIEERVLGLSQLLGEAESNDVGQG